MTIQPTSTPFEWPIIVYMILAGTSAGLAMTGGIALLSGKEFLRSIARQSLLLAALLIGVGFPFLVLDLERPQNFLYILYYFNPKSVIAWGARGISLYFMLLILTLVAQKLRPRVGLASALKVAALLLLPLSFFVAMYPGFVLNQATAHPLWSQPVLPVLFLASGLHMGLVSATLGRLWSASAPDFIPEPEDPLLHDHRGVRWLDGGFIVAQVVLFSLYLLSSWWTAPSAVGSLGEGANALLLWGGVVGIGWFIPASDMIFRGAKSNLVLRGVCVLLGGIALRLLIINGGQGATAFIGSGS